MAMPFIVFMTAFLFGAIELSFGHQGQYVVETRLVFDKSALDNFAKLLHNDTAKARELMESDAHFLINQVNQYFKSLERHHLKLDIRLNMVVFLNEDIFTDKDEYRLMGKKLANWMKNEISQNDMTVLLTGSKMEDFKRGMQLGAACRRKDSLAIVPYEGTQKTAMLMARMMAKSLGTGFDSSSCSDRSDISGYVMDWSMNPENKNRWYFTQCSAVRMIMRLTSLDILRSRHEKNCLKETTTEARSYDFTSLRNTKLGHIFHRYYICTRALQDSNARFCRIPNNELRVGGDELCQTMYCLSPATNNQCVPVMPTEGMPCSGTANDFTKICQRGKCILDPNGNSIGGLQSK